MRTAEGEWGIEFSGGASPRLTQQNLRVATSFVRRGSSASFQPDTRRFSIQTPVSKPGPTLGKVFKVEMLGSDVTLSFVQDNQGLTVRLSGSGQPASKFRVLRVTHGRGWINDDDRGATALEWVCRCNLGTRDFTTISPPATCPGISGVLCSPVAASQSSHRKKQEPKKSNSNRRSRRPIMDLPTVGTHQAQQVVCRLVELTPGKHVISIINRGSGAVSVDAILVREATLELYV